MKLFTKRCQVLGVRCQVLGVGCQVSGTGDSCVSRRGLHLVRSAYGLRRHVSALPECRPGSRGARFEIQAVQRACRRVQEKRCHATTLHTFHHVQSGSPSDPRHPAPGIQYMTFAFRPADTRHPAPITSPISS
jgi:hypothetical protein